MTFLNIDFDELIDKVNETLTVYSEGVVKRVIGLTIEVQGIKAFVGELVQYLINMENLCIVKWLGLEMIL